MPATHVALLRGINVGGKNRLGMTDLSALVREAGGRDVKTLIQSGNVVFSAPARVASTFDEALTRAISARFGLSVPVIVRTVDELGRVAGAHPLAREGLGPKHLHVGFLARDPASDRVARLDQGRSPPDSFAVRGREVYLACPNGMGRTKLTNAYFDATLGSISTFRNWNTVLALAELAGCGG